MWYVRGNLNVLLQSFSPTSIYRTGLQKLSIIAWPSYMITRWRYPTANVARQAVLTYRVGVAHPGHLQQADVTALLFTSVSLLFNMFDHGILCWIAIFLCLCWRIKLIINNNTITTEKLKIMLKFNSSFPSPPVPCSSSPFRFVPFLLFSIPHKSSLPYAAKGSVGMHAVK